MAIAHSALKHATQVAANAVDARWPRSHEGRCVYARCTGYKGRCAESRLGEESIADQFAAVLRVCTSRRTSSYVDIGVELVELARSAYQEFLSEESEKRRRLPELLFLNSSWKHFGLALQLHVPRFDLERGYQRPGGERVDLAKGIQRPDFQTGGEGEIWTRSTFRATASCPESRRARLD